jgi:serine/threonine-protein kinase
MGAFSDTKPAPDLLDMTLEEATKKAGEEGFRIKQGKDIYSSDYAEGRVCLQDPENGTETPKNGTITVNLSKGSKEGLVPNVIGMQENEVEEILENHGYVLGNTKVTTSPEPEGKVLEQDPVAGTTLDKESKVNIVISDGQGVEKASVPSVTRMSLEEAEKVFSPIHQFSQKTLETPAV